MNVKNIIAAATAAEMALLGISGRIIANAADNSDVTIDGVTYSSYEYEGKTYYSIEKVDENAKSVNIKSHINGSNVISMDNSAFYDCKVLKEITVDKDSKGFFSIDGVLYAKGSYSTMDSCDITLMCCPQGYEGELNIPANAGLHMYGDGWSASWAFFADCKKLTAINVASGNNNYYSEDGILYRKREFEKTYKYVEAIPRAKKITSYTVPKDVVLGDGFLCYNIYLKELHIYNGCGIDEYSLSGTGENFKDVYYDGTKADFLKYNSQYILTDSEFNFHFSDETIEGKQNSDENTNEAEQKSVEVSGTDLRISLSQADPNKDNAVDSSDATCILIDYANFMLNGTKKYAINEADANMDGVVDSSDATIILIYYANVLLGNQ